MYKCVNLVFEFESGDLDSCINIHTYTIGTAMYNGVI